MRLHYQSRIPIIGSRLLSNPKSRIPHRSPVWHLLNGSYTDSDYRSNVTNWERNTRQMSVIKPGRRLGGGWMADLVSGRRALCLCRDCERKYGDWHAKAHYQKRDRRSVSDCDGCGQVLQSCAAFYSQIV